jgi:hypothetical protein
MVNSCRGITDLTVPYRDSPRDTGFMSDINDLALSCIVMRRCLRRSYMTRLLLARSVPIDGVSWVELNEASISSSHLRCVVVDASHVARSVCITCLHNVHCLLVRHTAMILTTWCPALSSWHVVCSSIGQGVTYGHVR